MEVVWHEQGSTAAPSQAPHASAQATVDDPAAATRLGAGGPRGCSRILSTSDASRILLFLLHKT